MPFNPDKYLAEKQSAQADAPSTGAGFDPNQYLQSKGVQTLPNQGNIQDGATAAKSFAQTAGNAIANAASKGLSVGGLGRDLAPFVSAAFPTATDEAMGRDYGDRVLAAKADMDQSAAQSEAAFPTLSKVTQFITSIPKAIAIGGVLGKLGINGVSNQASAISGLEGLTQADKSKGYENLALQTGDAAVAGKLLGNFTQNLGDKFAEVVAPADKIVNQFGEQLGKDAVVDPLNPDRVGVEVKPVGNDAFNIKYQKFGGKTATAAKLGSEEGKLLTDPDLRAQVADDVAGVFGSDENPGKVPTLIQASKEKLGTIRDGILKDQGSAATDIEGSLKSAYDAHKTIDAAGDDKVQKAADDLLQRLQTIEGNLRTKSPTGSLDDVPLRDVFLQKQALGEALFGKNQIYRTAGPVRSRAIDLWSSLGKDVSDADPSGQVKTLTDAFSTLYRMEDNSINKASVLKAAFENPDAGDQRLAYKDFITPFTKMKPEDRSAFFPELQNYLAYDLPALMNKKAVVDAVNHVHDSPGGIGWVLNKLYLNKASAYNAAGGLGALQNRISNASFPNPSAQTLGQVNSSIQSSLPVAGSALGALTTDNSQPQGNPALKPLR